MTSFGPALSARPAAAIDFCATDCSHGQRAGPTRGRVTLPGAGLALLGLAVTGTVGWWGWIGVVPLATGLIGWCPAYALVGMNTVSARSNV